MPETGTSQQPAPRVKARPGRLFRRFRRTVRALFITLALAAVVLVVLTQGPVPRWLVAGAVRKATGGEFDASWVSLKLDGRFVATDATLRVPGGAGLPDEAARIASAGRVEVVLDWSAWAAGVVVPQSVRVVSPVVRVSVDKETGELNVSRLSASAPSAGVGRMPRVEFQGGVLVLSEHDSASVEVLTRLESDGWVSPIWGTRAYMVRLTATADDDPGLRLTVAGSLDLSRGHGEVRTSGLDLARLTSRRVPSAVRELWDSLRLRGRVEGVTLRYTPETGVDTSMKLSDVSLNAPIASGRQEITGSRSPRMESVNGDLRVISSGTQAGLRADLSGLFEDLPASLRFASRGLTLDAGYDAVLLARRFRLERDPRILWFTPEVVQRNFEKFSGPTAVIDARIELSRRSPEEPGVPGEISIAGALVFENGEAAYEKFPYPMKGLSGTVRFDDTRVQIVGIQGRGPTGARVFAEGVIEPPNAASSYNIRVTATDVPMDSVLRDAVLGSQGAPLIDAVFSQKRYDDLIAQGLVVGVSEEQGPVLAPAFEAFSGMIDSIQVHVTSAFGKDEPVHQDIAVRFQQVNALPEFFPYPLIGKDVTLRIGDHYFEARAERVTGLRGGEASIAARIDITRDKDGQSNGFDPTITVRSQGVPIEPLLINALPEPASKAGDKGGFSIRRVLSELNLNGPVDAVIKVAPAASDGADPRVEASIIFDQVTAKPAHAESSVEHGDSVPVSIEGLTGAIRAGSDGVWIDSLEGRLWPVLGAGDASGPPVSSWIRLDGEWTFDAVSGGSSLNLRAVDLDMGLGLEDVVRPIVPGVAETIGGLRARFSPAGRADLELAVERPTPGGLLSIEATATRAVNLRAVVADQRVEIIQRSGSLSARSEVGDSPEASSPLRVRLDELIAELRIDDQDVGLVSARGVITPPVPATPGSSGSPLLVHEQVEVELRGILIESPIARTLARRFGGTEADTALATYDPHGMLDGEIRLVPENVADPSEWKPWIALRPRWLAFNRDDEGMVERVLLPLISGQATIQPGGGLFEELVVIDDGWSARFNGSWSKGVASEGAEGPGGWTVDGVLDLDARGLPESLQALLPRSTRKAIADSDLRVFDDLQAPDLHVRISDDGVESTPLAFAVSGRVDVEGLYATPGVTITDAQGWLIIDARRSFSEPGALPARAVTTVQLGDGLLRLGGLRITGAAGTVRIDDSGVHVPSLTAEAYGGRLWLSAEAEDAGDPTRGESGAHYSGQVQVAGVRFADILADLRRQRTGLVGPGLPVRLATPEELSPLQADDTRGLLDAQLAIRGIAADPSSRRGRGEIRIGGGEAVLDLPGVGTVLSLASLKLPSSAPFDFAQAQVHLEGDVLTFQKAAILSDDLALLGAGIYRIDTGTLDARATGRSRARIPLISDVLDSLRDELVTVRIRGTPDAPEISYENFAAVRSAFRGRSNPLREALNTDLERLERDRQRSLRRAGSVQSLQDQPRE